MRPRQLSEAPPGVVPEPCDGRGGNAAVRQVLPAERHPFVPEPKRLCREREELWVIDVVVAQSNERHGQGISVCVSASSKATCSARKMRSTSPSRPSRFLATRHIV